MFITFKLLVLYDCAKGWRKQSGGAELFKDIVGQEVSLYRCADLCFGEDICKSYFYCHENWGAGGLLKPYKNHCILSKDPDNSSSKKNYQFCVPEGIMITQMLNSNQIKTIKDLVHCHSST